MLVRNMLPVNALSYLLLFLLTFCLVFPFPSAPLNKRNQDITWQVWLLVDDQNNHRVNSDVTPRKRITAKSVFIAPTFTPEDLPPCAEGYTSDPMGRCIKIIKLDEDKHLDFLVNKISDTFGDVDYEEEEIIEEMAVPNGPIQFSIPLSDGNGDYSNDSSQEESNFAIMFTPVEKDDNDNEGTIKLDKRDEQDTDLDLEVTNTTVKDDKSDIKDDTLSSHTDKYTTEFTTVSDVILETTITERTSTIDDRDNEYTTIKLQNDNINTNIKSDKLIEDLKTSTTTLESVNEDESYKTTTEINFFDKTTTDKEPETTNFDDFLGETTTVESKPESIKIIIDTNEYFKTESITEDSDTTIKPPTTTEIKLSSPERDAISSTPKITTYHPISTKVTTYHPHLNLESKNEGFIRFPNEKSEIRSQETTTGPKNNLVRFPDITNQEEGSKHHTRDVGGQMGNFVNEFEPLGRQDENRFKFPDELYNFGRRLREEDDHKDITNGQQYEYSMEKTTPKPFNRRNREKHNFFILPKDLMAKPPLKPSLPQEDLSFLFGNNKRTHRQTKSAKTDQDINR